VGQWNGGLPTGSALEPHVRQGGWRTPDSAPGGAGRRWCSASTVPASLAGPAT